MATDQSRELYSEAHLVATLLQLLGIDLAAHGHGDARLHLEHVRHAKHVVSIDAGLEKALTVSWTTSDATLVTFRVAPSLRA